MWSLLLVGLFVLAAAAVQGAKEPRIVEKDITFPELKLRGPVPIVDPPKRVAGYFQLDRTHDAHMFYFLFNSRNQKTDPVVLWMTGGPGCSSELAVFYENGPYSINHDMSLTETQWGWDKYHTTIFVDQPINTGFSYSEDDRDRVYGEAAVAEDMLDFLQEFFEVHPELSDRPFYVTGESYAGHYVPAVSHRVWEFNKQRPAGTKAINLQGIAIGNGLTNPGIQFPAYPDYALGNQLISPALHSSIKFWSPICTFATTLCNGLGWSWVCSIGVNLCMSITFAPILAANPDINVYDITKKCDGPLCYDFTDADKFLNLESTRQALGVGNRPWQGCDPSVYSDMTGDWLKDFSGTTLPAMLEDGIRVMIYAGELDLICNWYGNFQWVHAMDWAGAAAWRAAPEQDWMVLGKKAGTVKAAGALSFVKVAGAGHMVPMDQALNGLAMITAFTRGHALAAAPQPQLGQQQVQQVQQQQQQQQAQEGQQQEEVEAEALLRLLAQESPALSAAATASVEQLQPSEGAEVAARLRSQGAQQLRVSALPRRGQVRGKVPPVEVVEQK